MTILSSIEKEAAYCFAIVCRSDGLSVGLCTNLIKIRFWQTCCFYHAKDATSEVCLLNILLTLCFLVIKLCTLVATTEYRKTFLISGHLIKSRSDCQFSHLLFMSQLLNIYQCVLHQSVMDFYVGHSQRSSQFFCCRTQSCSDSRLSSSLQVIASLIFNIYFTFKPSR